MYGGSNLIYKCRLLTECDASYQKPTVPSFWVRGFSLHPCLRLVQRHVRIVLVFQVVEAVANVHQLP